MADYDVIVIGAGNGGLSSAATLAKSGKKVLVLEKHNIPGGCGTSFRRGRFEFEVALHQLSSMGTAVKPGPLRELFTEFGFVDNIDWVQIESLYRVSFPDKTGVTLPTTRGEIEKVLIAKFPNEKQGILDYFKLVYDFSMEMQSFLDAMAGSTGGEPSALKKLATKAFFKKKFPLLAKYGLKSTQEVLDQFFTSVELQLCLNAYWCFMGMPPERFPFSILARCTYIYVEDKPFFLRGGSQVISSSLAELITKCGGEIRYNCGVKEILLENKKAAGVLTEDGKKYSCRHIISNISPVHTYFNLLKPKDIPASAKKYLGGYKVGISALMCYIGLDCPPSEVGFKDSFNLIYDDTDANSSFVDAFKLMPESDPIVATCYTVDDPKVSPEGTSLITAGCLKYGEPWVELAPEQYYEMKYKAADMVLERLEKRFPGIRSHIEEIEVATPLTCMRYLSHPGGAVYGFEQDLKSTVFFFPRESHIKNLSFASGWVNICGFGPNYMYGNAVAKEVLKEVGR